METAPQRVPGTAEAAHVSDLETSSQTRRSCIRLWLYRHAYCVAFALSICVLLSPMLRDGIWKGHDRSAHTLRVLSTISALEANQYPPVINSAHDNALGYSWNLFYPPLSAYVVASLAMGLKALGISSLFAAMKLAWLCIILGSAASMHWFLRHVFRSQFAAILGACLYVTAPYFVSCVYIRFALGEIMMFVFLPLLALGLYSVFYEKGEKNWLLAAGVSGIVLSNIPASIILLLCLIFFSLLHIKRFRDKRIIRQVAVNAVLACGMTAFFVVPFFEQWRAGTVHAFVDMTGASLEFLTSQGIDIWWLLIPRKVTRMFFYYGFPILFCAGWLFFMVPQTKGTKIIAAFCLILTFAMSKWMPWKYIALGPADFVKYMQFPWRMLGVTIFLLCILSARNACLYFSDKAKPKALLATSAACVLAMFLVFPSGRLLTLYPKEAHTADYLPEKSIPFQSEFDTMQAVPVLSAGNAAITDIDKNKTGLSFSVANGGEASVIRLPYFAYVGYTATFRQIDGTAVDLPLHESQNGLWSVTIPGGARGAVFMAYTGTESAKLSFKLSLAAWGALALYIVANAIRRRRKPDAPRGVTAARET